MANYEREAKIAVVTGVVFAIAFGAGVDEWLRDSEHTFTKTATTLVFAVVAIINVFQAFAAMKKLREAAKGYADPTSVEP